MSVLTLCPVWVFGDGFCTAQTPMVMNPPMTYNATLGTPEAQNILPPYTNLPAVIYDLNGVGDSFGWNPSTAQWT